MPSARPSADFWGLSSAQNCHQTHSAGVLSLWKNPKPNSLGHSIQLPGWKQNELCKYCIRCTKPQLSSSYSQFRWPFFYQLIHSLENHFSDSCKCRKMALELPYGFSPRYEFCRGKGHCLLSISWLHKPKGRIGAKPSLHFLCKSMCSLLISETRKQSNACFSLIHSVK